MTPPVARDWRHLMSWNLAQTCTARSARYTFFCFLKNFRLPLLWSKKCQNRRLRLVFFGAFSKSRSDFGANGARLFRRPSCTKIPNLSIIGLAVLEYWGSKVGAEMQNSPYLRKIEIEDPGMCYWVPICIKGHHYMVYDQFRFILAKF